MVLVLTVDQDATLLPAVLPAVLCAGIGSALAILPCDLDPERCLIRLHEEGETDFVREFWDLALNLVMVRGGAFPVGRYLRRVGAVGRGRCVTGAVFR